MKICSLVKLASKWFFPNRTPITSLKWLRKCSREDSFAKIPSVWTKQMNSSIRKEISLIHLMPKIMIRGKQKNVRTRAARLNLKRKTLCVMKKYKSRKIPKSPNDIII